ncbi:MAG: hypothetical protein II727_06520 [Oscillospiraceae bacterium]|nr:hypothetical protein [Oscillospiraceae bacterium]
MKNWVGLIAAILILIFLSACSAKTADAKKDDYPSSVTTETFGKQDTAPAQTDAQDAETEKEAEPEETPSSEGAPEFAGIWGKDRATLEVVPQDDGTYLCLIYWGSSASETTYWEYPCRAEDKALVCESAGSKTEIVFDEDNTEQDTVAYTDGSARFVLDEEGGLTWEDEKENAGDGLVFTRSDTPMPSADSIADGYFRVLADIPTGTAGATILRAKAACDAFRFAWFNPLWAVDHNEFRETLLAAWESLTQEERDNFDANFIDVLTLVRDSAADWESEKGVFEDAGVDADMASLLRDKAALASWSILTGNTLTLGNSEE